MTHIRKLIRVVFKYNKYYISHIIYTVFVHYRFSQIPSDWKEFGPGFLLYYQLKKKRKKNDERNEILHRTRKKTEIPGSLHAEKKIINQNSFYSGNTVHWTKCVDSNNYIIWSKNNNIHVFLYYILLSINISNYFVLFLFDYQVTSGRKLTNEKNMAYTPLRFDF